MKVLNVGGGSSRELPPQYVGWEQILLDIDEKVNPDICLDAKELLTLTEAQFDAIYCSHNLEHFYKHEVPVVLEGFTPILKPGGFIEVHVPNLPYMFEVMKQGNMDLDDVWYRNGAGMPITFHDTLYGWNIAMQQGNIFYSHKCGFSPTSLAKVVSASGFQVKDIRANGSNLSIIAYKPKEV
jgi:SAM-dependent methyltransferase